MTTAALNAESTQCPFHPEPYLRKPTKWKSIRPIADAVGDEVYYCAGNGGRCSWTYSRDYGLLISAGLERPTGWEVSRVYQRVIAANSQTAKAKPKDYGPAPWES